MSEPEERSYELVLESNDEFKDVMAEPEGTARHARASTREARPAPPRPTRDGGDGGEHNRSPVACGGHVTALPPPPVPAPAPAPQRWSVQTVVRTDGGPGNVRAKTVVGPGDRGGPYR